MAFGMPFNAANLYGQQPRQQAPGGGIGGAVGGVAQPMGSFGMGGAGRSAGMFGQQAPGASYGSMMGRFGAGGAGGAGGAASFGAARPQQQQMMSFRQPQQQQTTAPSMAQRVSPAMGAFALSDERSKQKIQDLEALNQRYQDLLDQPAAKMPELRDPTSALDEAYRRPGSYSYEYKNPSAAGAAPGRQVGPMADELRGIPGVVQRGPDGLDRVDTPRLTMANTSQVAKQRRELDDLRAQLDALGEQGAISPAESDAVSRSFGR